MINDKLSKHYEDGTIKKHINNNLDGYYCSGIVLI